MLLAKDRYERVGGQITRFLPQEHLWASTALSGLLDLEKVGTKNQKGADFLGNSVDS